MKFNVEVKGIVDIQHKFSCFIDLLNDLSLSLLSFSVLSDLLAMTPRVANWKPTAFDTTSMEAMSLTT